MMINQETVTLTVGLMGKVNPLKDTEKDLSDKLKPEHRSNDEERSTGLILVDAQDKRRIFFAYVSLLNMPTVVADYQLRGLGIRYYATDLHYSSFQEAVRIFRSTKSVDEVRDFLTLPLQEQEKNKYRDEKC